jgi:hypothetical protein
MQEICARSQKDEKDPEFEATDPFLPKTEQERWKRTLAVDGKSLDSKNVPRK